MVTVIEGAVPGSEKLSSNEEKDPDFTWKYVLLSVLSRLLLQLIIMVSIILPRPNVRSEPIGKIVSVSNILF